jgi:hypothetical protein
MEYETERDHLGLYRILEKTLTKEVTILQDGTKKIEMIEIKKIQREIINSPKTKAKGYWKLEVLYSEIESHIDLIRDSRRPKNIHKEYRTLCDIQSNIDNGKIDYNEAMLNMNEFYEKLKRTYSPRAS